MLTRAYDAIMALLQVPAIRNQNVDFNNTTIDDSVLNCKNYSGTIRCLYMGIFSDGSSIGYTSSVINVLSIPFAFFHTSGRNSVLLPDEEESAPDYEDYSVTNETPSGWTVSSQYPSFSKSYDPDTKEIVCSVTMLWQNTSGAAKTVYGVKVRCYFPYRNAYDDISNVWDYFLVCREHFASPVVVEDQGIISLTFTWRVGRAGLVSATAASAK